MSNFEKLVSAVKARFGHLGFADQRAIVRGYSTVKFEQAIEAIEQGHASLWSAKKAGVLKDDAND